MSENLDSRIAVLEAREHLVVKHNYLVQRSRYKLSAIEQKTINFVISLVKPKDAYPDGVQPRIYQFEIKDFCKACGIDWKNGTNFSMVRKTLKQLRDRSVYMPTETGEEVTLAWFTHVWVNKGTGLARVEFDEMIAPYVFELADKTTRFQLISILPMQSKYSIRLYELCKSWSHITTKKDYSLDDLRYLLDVPEGKLERVADFRRKVLEVAETEINEFSDISIKYSYKKIKNKIVGVKITIRTKSKEDIKKANCAVTQTLDGYSSKEAEIASQFQKDHEAENS